MKQRLSKFFSFCFAGLVVLFLGLGLVDAVLFPEDISQYEQRTLNKLPALGADDDIYIYISDCQRTMLLCRKTESQGSSRGQGPPRI